MLVHGLKHDVSEVFFGFRSGERGEPVNGIYSFILHELPPCPHHMRCGIVVHQEDLKIHCTSLTVAPRNLSL